MGHFCEVLGRFGCYLQCRWHLPVITLTLYVLEPYISSPLTDKIPKNLFGEMVSFFVIFKMFIQGS
jgi:hypothetical protein